MKYQEYTDDIIGIVVTVAGTAFAGYITYTTGQIPEFFAVAFGAIMTFHFTRKKNNED